MKTLQVKLDSLLIPGDEFEIDAADFEVATSKELFNSPCPRPKGKKVCIVKRVYNRPDAKEIFYVCQAKNPTQYTPSTEFLISQLIDLEKLHIL